MTRCKTCTSQIAANALRCANCRREHRREIRREWKRRRRLFGLAPKISKPCEYCETVMHDVYDHKKFCSSDCRTSAYYERNGARMRQRLRDVYAIAREQIGPKFCKQCGLELGKWRGKFCSTECQTEFRRASHPRQSPPHCRACGRVITEQSPSNGHFFQFCSEDCRLQANREGSRRAYNRKRSLDILRKRKRRADIQVAIFAYNELFGIENMVRHGFQFRVAAKSPVLKFGEWITYIVLPERNGRIRGGYHGTAGAILRQKHFKLRHHTRGNTAAQLPARRRRGRRNIAIFEAMKELDLI